MFVDLIIPYIGLNKHHMHGLIDFLKSFCILDFFFFFVVLPTLVYSS